MQLKLRTIKFIIKEGFANTWKNKLMCLASMGTVIAALIILGIFILIGTNVKMVISQIEANQQVQVCLDRGIAQDKIPDIKARIEQLGFTSEIKYISKEEGLNALKKMPMFKGHERLLSGYEKDNPIPPKFILVLKKAEYGNQAVIALKNMAEIGSVNYNPEITKNLTRICNIVSLVSFIVLILLSITAVFIISNTIKITVFARRKEIGIMKYIGATDWFIRWPFIIESIIIGTLASFSALLIMKWSYGAIIKYIGTAQAPSELGIVNFANFNSVSYNMMIAYLIIGIGIGCMGSAISIRKHLRV